MRVTNLTNRTEEEWAAFIGNHPVATVFHTLAWKRTLERVFEYEPRYVLVFEDGEVVAAMPGFRVPELGGYSVVNPFCEYGFPLVAEGTDLTTVLDALADGIGRGGALILKECPFSDGRGYSQTGFGGVQTGITFRLALNVPFDRIQDDVFDPTLRTDLRRADEMVTVTDPGIDGLGHFYSLYLRTMRRFGSPQFPRSFFHELADQFGTSFSLRLAEIDGEVVAGLVSLEWGDICYLWSNGTNAAYWGEKPNHLLFADVIKRACDRGDDVVDFGRTEVGTGVYRFKSRFGATEYPTVSFVTPPRRIARASVSGYKRLEPVTRVLNSVITHPSVGPKLKRFIHE